MTQDLTFWQNYGPFIISLITAFIVGGGLVLFGGRVAQLYEKTMVTQAEHFRAMATGRRKRKRSTVEKSLNQVRNKAQGARKLQIVALYFTTVFVGYHLAQMIVSLGNTEGFLKWILALAVMAVLFVAVWYAERRSASERKNRLSIQTDLDQEEIPVT